MIYVALLRGINVGGANKVGMKPLAEAVEGAGMRSVTTYINSGNVIFSSGLRSRARLAAVVEEAIAERFGFRIKVLVRDLASMRSIVRAIPARWTTDATMRCDVLFLWPDVDRPSVLDSLTVKPGIDDVRYERGALIWRVDREAVTRSGLMRLAGTSLYKNVTIRNSNTARKLLALMEAARR